MAASRTPPRNPPRGTSRDPSRGTSRGGGGGAGGRGPRRRVWPAALAAFAVATAAGTAGGWYVGSRERVPSALRLEGGPTTASTETTTVPLEVPTTAPSETTVPPETTVAPTRPPTTAPRPDPIELGAGGSSLVTPSNPERRLVADPGDCAALAGSGSAVSCGRFESRGVSVAWVRDANGTFDVLTRDESADGGDVWVQRLTGDGTNIAEDPRTADVSGDGEADLVVGLRTAEDLLVDVVEVRGATPTVTLHLDLPGGRARVTGGELLVWLPVGDGRLARSSLTAAGGDWKVASSEYVDAGGVGPSQF